MISIEAAREGFTLSYGGRPLIVHSSRKPCLSIGWAELSYRQNRGAFRPSRRRTAWAALRSFKVVENGPDFTAIDFEGRIRMGIRLQEGRLRFTFSRYDSGVQLFRLRLKAWPEERIHGLGERRGRLDAKGLRVPLWVEDRETLRGSFSRFLAAFRGFGDRVEASRFPLPLFVSSMRYWCAVDTSARVILDFRRKGVTLVESWAVPREIVVGAAEDAPALLGDLASIQGRQPESPSWAFDGAMLDLGGGGETLLRRVDGAVDAGAKLAAVAIREAFVGSGRFRGEDFRRGGRPAPISAAAGGADREGWEALVAQCKARGLKALGRADPYLAPGGRRFAEAREGGFCVVDAAGAPCLVPAAGGSVAFVDLTNPDAAAWLKASLRAELLDRGLSGWIADSGEYLPADARLHSGEPASLAHNRWPLLWAKLNREALAEAGRAGDALLVFRSGWLGSARHAPVVAVGEGESGRKRGGELLASVSASLSLGMSGLGVSCIEVGAHWGPGRRRGEAILRALELAAFSPLFRVREDCWGEAAARDGLPEERFVPLLARMSEVFSALKPYHVAVAKEYQFAGLPAIRQPCIHYGQDPALSVLSGQYLYGRDLILAPAAPGAELTEVLLPPDEWTHLWSSRRFRGGPVTVESPFGFPAVFYRVDSAFAPLFDTIRRTTRRA
ncbi:MAG: hypothetical protein JNG85_01640 [Spirochaetaceae bacterium]|nr:hypothetical protein [Spirochaetaceae bacterium]